MVTRTRSSVNSGFELRPHRDRETFRWITERLASSFIRLHVPQPIVQVVDVLDADPFVDFFSVSKTNQDQ